MSRANALQSLHEAMGAAIMRDLLPVPFVRPVARHEDMPEGTTKTIFCRPDDEDVDVVMFSQTWGSSLLGYGGDGDWGSSAMTRAYTVVIRTERDACVYFGISRLAYHCVFDEMTQEQQDKFADDAQKRRLVGRKEAVSLYGAKLGVDPTYEVRFNKPESLAKAAKSSKVVAKAVKSPNTSRPPRTIRR